MTNDFTIALKEELKLLSNKNLTFFREKPANNMYSDSEVEDDVGNSSFVFQS